ncbi:MAG: D-2-hydroxyacid dehydrogenase family protein [Mycobacteriales bacterium]
MRIAVLDDYQDAARSATDWEPLQRRAEVTFFREPIATPEDIRSKLRDFEILCLMRERLPFPRATFALLPELQCLVTTGTANRAIDLQAAVEHAVVVCGTTNSSGGLATAELTWGLLLALARRIPQEDRAVRAGQWQTSVGTGLHGRTLGVVGLGRVGTAVAGYGVAFGMEILAWSRSLTDERARESGAHRVELDELLARSDVVSLHTVLAAETTGLIGPAELDRMQTSALLVNTSRGPVVDEAALVAALRTGGIAGAAIDVFDREPLPAVHPFLDLDNVVLSPHLGYVTTEVYAEFYRETVRTVLAYLDGSPIRVLLP